MEIERQTAIRSSLRDAYYLDQPPIDLAEAMQRIKDDTIQYPIYGLKDITTTRFQVYEQIFGQQARKGKTSIDPEDGRERYIPGYYELFPYLTPEEIDDILVPHIITLATSRIFTNISVFVEQDLKKANSQTRQHNQTAHQPQPSLQRA